MPTIRGKLLTCTLSPKEELVINEAILPKEVDHAFTDKTGKITRFSGLESNQDVKFPPADC